MKRIVLDAIMCVLTAACVLLIGGMNAEYIAGEYTAGAFVKQYWPMYVALLTCGIPAAALWLRRFD